MGSRPGVLGGLHIVVVDDNEDAREILRGVLEHFGALVTTSASARGGLHALRQLKPDVVITDMALNDHRAPWLLREARTIDCTAPFILVSGMDVDQRQALAQGFAFVLTKPVGHEHLVRTVLRALEAR